MSRRRALDKRLCSIELHAPTQVRDSESFALFVVLNFDIKPMKFTVEDTEFQLRYGFHAAEVRLELKRCQIAPTGRYVRLLQPLRIELEEETQKKRSRSASASINLGLPKVFGLITGSGAISSTRHSALKATMIEKGVLEIQRAVVQRHGEYWRVYGIEHPDGVLCGQVLGDEKLCEIVHANARCTVAASVYGDVSDLWIDIESAETGRIILEAARRGVCSALLAKTLARPDEEFDEEGLRGPLQLSRDELKFTPGPNARLKGEGGAGPRS